MASAQELIQSIAQGIGLLQKYTETNAWEEDQLKDLSHADSLIWEIIEEIEEKIK